MASAPPVRDARSARDRLIGDEAVSTGLGQGSPRLPQPLCEFSRVHWLRPEVVVEVTFSTWMADGLIRQSSYQGQRHDKPAKDVVRSAPKRRTK